MMRSSLAAATLQQLGFCHATDADGGFQTWRQAGLPVNAPGGLRMEIAADPVSRH
jgi:rhodanese-related sulfurtransferase